MSVPRDDLLDLDPGEARELEALEERLRASKPKMDDPAFFDALHQRIMNEVEVTPTPSTARGRGPAPAGWPARLLAWLRTSPVAATGALAAAVALLLVLWVTSRDPGSDLPATVVDGAGQGESVPEELPAPDGEAAATDELAGVPDELWDEGFLAYSWELESDDEAAEVLAMLDDDGYDDEQAEDDAFDELDYGLSSGSGWGTWSLEELSNEELLALERALEG